MLLRNYFRRLLIKFLSLWLIAQNLTFWAFWSMSLIFLLWPDINTFLAGFLAFHQFRLPFVKDKLGWLTDQLLYRRGFIRCVSENLKLRNRQIFWLYLGAQFITRLQLYQRCVIWWDFKTRCVLLMNLQLTFRRLRVLRIIWRWIITRLFRFNHA